MGLQNLVMTQVRWKSDDVIPHTHDIKKPMSLFNFTFENINNVKVPKGSRVYDFL